MKKNSLVILAILITFLLTGCSRKTTIEPLVENCCENKSIIKTNKKIYIGNFTLKNPNNIKNIYGTRSIKSNSEDIMFEENYGDIVRNELYKKLQGISSNVQLVSQKPNSFNENDSIYIEGNIEKIWINQEIPIRQTKFNTTSIFDFKINSTMNGKPISDNFDAKLELIVQNIQIAKRYWTILLNTFGDGSEESQLIKHRLIINNQVIADFDYFQFLENPIANFTTDYNLAIHGDIYGKYPQKLNDNSRGNVHKFEIYNMPYSYISPNLNTSPGYNFYGNDTFEKYLSKSELKKIKENYDLEKKEYDECAKNKSNENCIKPTAKNIENTKYYDIFRLYSTNSGILQYMTNVHIDNIIDEINKK
jgi:hypothetical protein